MATGRKTGGRKKGTPNKATAQIKELAQAAAPDAMKALLQIVKDGESEAARVTAIKEIFDRAYGKSVQSNEHSGPNGTPLLPPTLLIAPFTGQDDNDTD